ncbi:hypothetical protein COF45_25075 [Bacillus wiedmannii]|uniref:hypothetical protein n=1 Tax=Bacillus wiedmannii TaxID=1890302 RepID=UPI000BFBCB75|nr:hypothetical protein [Bacillus wiedmannii]PHD06609.1 hypothetical protein COF45_25075 [Bacillus wiedmannii]
MTLIAGIILPFGILMLSNTCTLENNNFVHNENTRKITAITPNMLLGTSGFEANYNTAQVLRQTLYGKKRLTNENIRWCIANLYKRVSNFHLVVRDFPEPLGHILLGEFTEYNLVKDIALIGSTPSINANVKNQTLGFLDSIELGNPGAPRKITELYHNIFKNEAETYKGINQYPCP